MHPQLEGGTVLVSKGGNVIQVASADFTFVGGVMQMRTSERFDANGRLIRETTANSTTTARVGGAAVQTSAYAGVQQSISSTMPIDSLIELNFLHVSSLCCRLRVCQTLHGTSL